jgi:site-specific DNA-methyltransferase (adenine-specific)
MTIDLRYGDCLVEMKEIDDNSVDLIYCDLPFGTTQCSWDEVIPFKDMWEQVIRITKKTHR